MAVPASLLQDLLSIPGCDATADAPLGQLTTIGTGGKAALLVTVEEASVASRVLGLLEADACPHYCLGAGSDLLVADAGYDGAVIRLGDSLQRMEGLAPEPVGEGGPNLLSVPAGLLVSRLAAYAAEVGLTGLEFACGIPGSVGGAVATNAGAYGRAMADVLCEVELADAEGVRWVDSHELEWHYRACRLPAGALVTAARLCLTQGDSEAIVESQESILAMRREVQPQGVLTFGSTFKNPSGGAAGRLIEAAGLKGERRGDAEVSRVHANFVVNLGDATTADVLALMDHMRHRVHETSGVWLEPEVRLLGTGFPWESSAGDSRRTSPADG